MPTIDIIATLAIIAVFGAFMVTLARTEKQNRKTWKEFE
jgi:hypothetical protein